VEPVRRVLVPQPDPHVDLDGPWLSRRHDRSRAAR
jgi:hypothetical protein